MTYQLGQEQNKETYKYLASKVIQRMIRKVSSLIFIIIAL